MNDQTLNAFWKAVKHVYCLPLLTVKWTSSWDFGTYHTGDQRRLRRACISAQSRQSLRCSHTWSMEVNEGSDQNIRHLAPLDGCACAFEEWVYGGRKVYHNLMSWLKYFFITHLSINVWSDVLLCFVKPICVLSINECFWEKKLTHACRLALILKVGQMGTSCFFTRAVTLKILQNIGI